MAPAIATKRMTEMFELLQESDQGLILNFVSRLLPDDVATQEDIDDMNQAEAEYSRGECYTLDDLTLVNSDPGGREGRLGGSDSDDSVDLRHL